MIYFDGKRRQITVTYYSLGQSSDNRLSTTAGRSTFIFGFQGVGGTAAPDAVPEPATWAMMLLGFAMIGYGIRSGMRRSTVKFDARIKRIASGLEA